MTAPVPKSTSPKLSQMSKRLLAKLLKRATRLELYVVASVIGWLSQTESAAMEIEKWLSALANLFGGL